MKPVKVRISTLILAFYIILSFLFFILIVEPSLAGKNNLRVSADSHAYILYSHILIAQGNLLTINQNFLGPALILEAVNYNNLLVVLFNYGLFFISYRILIRNLRLDRIRFLSLLFINPIFFVSLLAINKEILGVCTVLFLASFLASGKLRYLGITLVLSILTRWHMTAVILIFLLAASRFNPIKKYRWGTLGLLILVITLAFPLFLGSTFDILHPEVALRQQETSLGLTNIMNSLQYNFGFFVIVIPKILFNYFGNLLRAFDFFLRPQAVDHNDLYNTYFLLIHQYLMLFVVFLLVQKKRFHPRSMIIYFCLVYSIIFAISLFIQYRYFFPLYVLFCLELSLPPDQQLVDLFLKRGSTRRSERAGGLKVHPSLPGLSTVSTE